MVTPLTDFEFQAYRLEKALEDLKWCAAAAALDPFRAGDRVKHAPSGETWILACDQDDNQVMPCGWPESVAEATHCRLDERASDSARIAMLKAVANPSPGRIGGKRHRLAAQQLEALTEGNIAATSPFFDPGESRYDRPPEDGS